MLRQENPTWFKNSSSQPQSHRATPQPGSACGAAHRHCSLLPPLLPMLSSSSLPSVAISCIGNFQPICKMKQMVEKRRGDLPQKPPGREPLGYFPTLKYGQPYKAFFLHHHQAQSLLQQGCEICLWGGFFMIADSLLPVELQDF